VTPNTFHKVDELRVDDKIEASPLYVADVNTTSGPHDLLIVATTNNTVYAFDAKNAMQVWSKSLGHSVQGIKPALYDKWGITSTPVVDPDTDTLYVVRLAWENGNKLYRLVGLRLSDGTEEFQSQVIDGFSVKRNGKFFPMVDRSNGAGFVEEFMDRRPSYSAFPVAKMPTAQTVGFTPWRNSRGGNVTPAVWCSTAAAAVSGWPREARHRRQRPDIYFATAMAI
jgi:hypothetical protein